MTITDVCWEAIGNKGMTLETFEKLDSLKKISSLDAAMISILKRRIAAGKIKLYTPSLY